MAMTRRKITLEVDIDWKSDEANFERELRWMLMDALSEYRSNRGNGVAREYVEKRYLDQPEAWREEKIRTTQKRLRISENVHRAVGTMMVEKLEQDDDA
jgi:hypothetical protein